MQDERDTQDGLEDHSSRKVVIAIDGLSSCGKTTLAKDLARHLQWLHIDSGAMYRALTWLMLQKGWTIEELLRHLQDVELELTRENGEALIRINGQVVRDELRDPRVTEHVSAVSMIPEVRRFLVEKQRAAARNASVIMDGRDIGTVVFPHADIKFYLTADEDVRVRRRHRELLEKGYEIDEEEVRRQIRQRDHLDTTRAHSPLRKAEDAIVLDTSHLSRSEQLEEALKIIRRRLEKITSP